MHPRCTLQIFTSIPPDLHEPSILSATWHLRRTHDHRLSFALKKKRGTQYADSAGRCTPHRLTSAHWNNQHQSLIKPPPEHRAPAEAECKPSADSLWPRP